MTISYKTYSEIRQLFGEGVSQRGISRKLKISRKTVKKYCEGETYPGKIEVDKIRTKKATDEKRLVVSGIIYKETVDGSGKQRASASAMWERNKDQIPNIKKASFLAYCKKLGFNKKFKSFIPLTFKPGEVTQVDWVQVTVNIAGEKVKLPVLAVVSSFSYRIHASIMPNMKLESMCAGLVDAFRSFGGTTSTFFFDNCKSCVYKNSGKFAVLQPRFEKFAGHYRFKPVFMNAGKGNEKGKVENLCKIIEKRILPNLPTFNSLSEAQDCITSRVNVYNNKHKLRYEKLSIAEKFEEEKKFLIDLPKSHFDTFFTKSVLVNSKLLFEFETNRYSVPEPYVNKTITLRVFPYYIECWYNGIMIAKHERLVTKNGIRYIVEHYLNALLAKPRAWNHADPLLNGKTHPEIEIFRNKCKEKNLGEQLMNIYLRIKNFDFHKVIEAVKFANSYDNPNIQHIDNYLKVGHPSNKDYYRKVDYNEYNNLIPKTKQGENDEEK
ncbi:MAG: IS21 family transposase [Clostridiales Family XIII bacterium]|jgi:transposase|nr:IS21 family transposase [Clostridiales Family XIII bacterium]